MDHPAISQAVVFGIKHEHDGHVPFGVIVPASEYKDKLTEDDINRYILEKLPDRMRLRGGVKFVDYLPVTPSGKFRRKEIKDQVLKERNSIK